MKLVECIDAASFLERTETYRERNPWLTNVIGSVALSVADGVRTYDHHRWWVVEERDEVILAAMRTAPHPVSLGPGPTAAAQLVGAVVAQGADDTEGFNGPEHVVNAALVGYQSTSSKGSRREARITRRDVVYVLEGLRTPDVTGAARRAELADEEIVLKWVRDFHDELDIPHVSLEGNLARLAQGSFWLWHNNGLPVSLAGYASAVATPSGAITRIGPVYTPVPHRGHGFAAGVTAAVCREITTSGSSVMLYADADNPTSNGVYQRLGFAHVDDVISLSMLTKAIEPS